MFIRPTRKKRSRYPNGALTPTNPDWNRLDGVPQRGTRSPFCWIQCPNGVPTGLVAVLDYRHTVGAHATFVW